MLATVEALPINDDKNGGVLGRDNCAGNGIPLLSRQRIVGNVAFVCLLQGFGLGGFFFSGNVRCFFVALNLILKCIVVLATSSALTTAQNDRHPMAMLSC